MGWTTERARLAALHRYRKPDDPAVVRATRDLAVERLIEQARRVVAAKPPLTSEQCDAIAAVLRNADDGAGQGVVADAIL
jgi:hypothetical protein